MRGLEPALAQAFDSGTSTPDKAGGNVADFVNTFFEFFPGRNLPLEDSSTIHRLTPPEWACIIMLITMKLKLRSVGTSTGILLPKEMLIRMKVEKDDELFAVETPDGYLLTPYDPEVMNQVELGRTLLRRHRNVLRALAK